ncbi:MULTISPECIES: hypothetical protein [Pseudanabaena]|uniref:hypothetical protein n=1 Tax=Pseudanabaena TaxID=1152 RepID=UPI0024789A60|nr:MULTISPECIES: hypothetical protein [Pseudanabaena]MEA5487188.1 hypothetical protein [Pseudanabaena sp. CCNP1317]WGS75346.1 hypothetical protein OA858_25680 [Pseudanabaena galeata CCNP1313]
MTFSYNIDWQHEEHKVQYSFTQEQLALIATYEAPLKIKLAEEQAAKYREDPDRYCNLSSTASMVALGKYEPYTGAIGEVSTFLFYLTSDDEYIVKYQYANYEPICLTALDSPTTSRLYKVIPTSLGYLVSYSLDGEIVCEIFDDL